MFRSCVDPALVVLKLVLEHPRHAAKLQTPIQAMDRDLKFFKMFFWGLAYLEDSSEDDWRLRGSWSTMMAKFMQTAEDFKMQLEYAADRGRKLSSWEALSGPLRRLITQYKAQVKEICNMLLKGKFAYRVCDSEKYIVDYGEDTLCFIHFLLQNLGALELDTDVIERKLRVFEMFAHVAKDSPTVAEAAKVVSHVQTWAIHVSCFACLYWVDGDGDDKDSRGGMFTYLMDRYMPYTLEVISMYLELLKGSRYNDFQGSVITQLLVCYVDFLLENLVASGEDDTDIESLRHGMVFLLSFVMDPVVEDSVERKLILAQIHGTLSEVPLVICSPQTKLSGFMEVIDRVKIQVRELYVLNPLMSPFNSAKTNALGFLDRFVANLKKMLDGKVDFLSFVKHQVEIIQKQLTWFRPVLQIMELQNEHATQNDLWTRVVDVVYFAAYVTNLCPMTSRSLWYGILFLPDVIEDIKLVKSKVKHDRLYIIKCAIAEMKSSNFSQPEASKDEVPMIGYQQEVEEILYDLREGQSYLTLISISGMAGQGKTTLAKRVCYSPSIQCHFHMFAWCYISKDLTGSEILTDILRQLGYKDYGGLEVADLSEMLWKHLKGKRYLIVLDDIWDAFVWRQLKWSFPDDKNGSRILYTSQNHDLASQSEFYTVSHRLHLFSDEECWELMKYKLSNSVAFPQEIIETGKLISCYCKGLPLTVTRIASVLSKAGLVLDLWKVVAEHLISETYIAIPESMDLIEMSYKYLPDHLKPCFLYLVGAFGCGQDFSAKKLKLLWIAEGFMNENGKQPQDLAKECLDNLISRNFVVVVERSSTGGIKRCKVHDDRLYDLCFAKAVQDKFWVDKINFYGTQSYDFHHRLSIDENDTYIMPEYACNLKELPTNLIHSLLWNGYKSIENYSMSWFLSRFRFLTVLDLGVLYLTYFPEVILYNIHLTYLALGGDIKDIPHSLRDLWNLETLIVRGGDVVQIPDILWEMETLKHVHVHRIRLHLKDLLPNESSTAAARNIEVLGEIILKYDLKTMEFLRRLPRLKMLKSGCDDKVIHRLWFSMFGSLEKLESLHLYYSGSGGLLSNRQLPTVNFPNNLRKLTVASFKLPWSVMSTIGKLPNLEVLKLHHWICMGSTWYLADGDFLKLNYLKLYRMDVELIDDSACENPFPCLKSLFLLGCWKLREIPSRFEGICTLDTSYAVGVSSSHPKVPYSKRSIPCSGLVEQILEPRKEMRSCNVHDVLKAALRGSLLNTVPHAHHLPLSYKCLTVLDLERVYLHMFAEEILYLSRLRFLSVCGNFEYIPASIVDLWNLETLMVRSGHVVQLPDILWGVNSLRYVDVTNSCLHLTDFWEKEPSVVGAYNIEVLSGLILGPGYDEFMSRLVRLKVLKCYFDASKTQTSWFSEFGSLKNLEYLSVCALGQFFSHQPFLLLTYTFPENLMKLNLSGTRLPWSVMSVVGKLPNLQVLRLHSKACAGSTWRLEDGDFPKLRYLKLKNMDVERIDDCGCDDNPFPSLERLLLLGCWSLVEIPPSFGRSCTLETIRVASCHPKLSHLLRRISEEQQDMGNYHLWALTDRPYDNDEATNLKPLQPIELLPESYLVVIHL